MIDLDKNVEKIKQYVREKGIASIMRSTLFLACSMTCVYQCTESIFEYYKYNTNMQVRISSPDDQSMPAITVCRQMTASEYFDLLLQNDLEYAKKYNDKNSKSSSTVPVDQNLTEEQEEAKQWGALSHIADYVRQSSKNSKDLFNIIKIFLNVSCTDVRTRTPQPCEMSANRIEHFTQRRICVTYFSRLYTNFNFSENNFKNGSENGTEKQEDQERVFAWLQIDNPNNDIFVYIHTSKAMPDINLYDLEMTRSRVFNNRTYGIIYSKFWVQRLEPPYATLCSNYIAQRKGPMDPLSEFGCITRCKKRIWKENASDPCIPIDLTVVLQSDDVIYNICNCTVKPCDLTLQSCQKCPEADDEEYKKLVRNCERSCHQDCYEEYYQKDIFELQDDFKMKTWQKYDVNKTDRMVETNQTLVFLAAKYHEELSYTHAPKMVSFDFFAAMGGLFSLWIGASVLTIFDFLEFLVKLWLRMHSHVKMTTDKFKNSKEQRAPRNPGIRVRHDEKRRREILGEYQPTINYPPGYQPGWNQPYPAHQTSPYPAHRIRHGEIRPRAPNFNSYHY